MVCDGHIQIAYLDAVVHLDQQTCFKGHKTWLLTHFVSRSQEAGMTFEISFYRRKSQSQLHALTASSDPA